MKNIKVHTVSKYSDTQYQETAVGIYKYGNSYVTTLCFEQEPELGEGTSAADISQYPLEDVLERFNVHVSDFYPELNIAKNTACYLEFSGSKKNNITELLSIVGKHVYNKIVYENGEECVALIIE